MECVPTMFGAGELCTVPYLSPERAANLAQEQPAKPFMCAAALAAPPPLGY